MKDSPLKRASVIFMIVFVATSLVVGILWSLFAYWSSGKVPVAYVISEVVPNRDYTDICDTSRVTILKNAITGQIKYECGNLGKPNEVITFYE